VYLVLQALLSYLVVYLNPIFSNLDCQLQFEENLENSGILCTPVKNGRFCKDGNMCVYCNLITGVVHLFSSFFEDFIN
jgi:hypothetical protein